jgi:hypothetical protein
VELLAPDGPAGRFRRSRRIIGAGSVSPPGRVSLVRAVNPLRPHRVSLLKAARVNLLKKPSDQRYRWAAFAPEPLRPPSRVRRVLGRVGRIVGHEWSLASLASALLAVVMTWPALRHPTSTVPQDLGDPLLQAWQMAWSGHALKTDPAELWHSNSFYPERFSFAFSDTLLGYAPLGILGNGVAAALLRYNMAFVLAFALAFLGAYALVRQLGAGRAGALVAGAAFAYAPWRWGSGGHLNVLSSGGIVLALAMLARGHGFSLRDGYQPDRVKIGWVIAGWAVAAWQLSLGFGIGLPFAYALGVIVVLAAAAWALRIDGRLRLFGWWATRRRIPFRLALADLGGIALFVAAGAALAYPYLRVVGEHANSRRTTGDVDLYSPPAHGFLTAPEQSWLWGGRHTDLRAGLMSPPENARLLGYVLIGLALAGLVYSIWSAYVRFVLLVGMAGTALLAMGTNAPFDGEASYLLLYKLPGWDGLRTPGRLVLWTTLFAALLAAGAVGAFAARIHEYVAERVPARPGVLLRAAMVLPLALVLIEGIPDRDQPTVPPAPAALRSAEAPILVLPTNPVHDEAVMLWSTDGFPAIVNGGSGFTPERQAEVREVTENFPDAASIRLLRDLGVRTVIVLLDRVRGTPYAGAVEADAEGLDIEREETPEAIIFRL